MAFQEILQNNPKAFVYDGTYMRDVYDAVNKRIVGEATVNDTVFDTVYAIPEHDIDMVNALMTSTTLFRSELDNLAFYARSLLWYYIDERLTCKRLIPEQYHPYFDKSPLCIYIGTVYAYTHQSRNVLLITRYYYHAQYDLPDYILIVLPEKFAITTHLDDYRSQSFTVLDSTTQQSYYCYLKYDWDYTSYATFLKVISCTVDTAEFVDIGLRVITD